MTARDRYYEARGILLGTLCGIFASSLGVVAWAWVWWPL